MVSIILAGDFCPLDRIAAMMQKNDYTFFDDIRNCVAAADYSIVNLECPIVEDLQKPITKCGPSLKCSPNVINAIKYAGFKGVTLANNHLNDYGESGIMTTLQCIDKEGLDRVGGGKTLKNSQKPLCLKVQEKTISIINVCESEFSIATKYSAGASPIDLIDCSRAIIDCKRETDYVIVVVHGGHEMHQLPSPMMQKSYRWFIDLGADTVINHHQHCYSGYEVYNNKPIFYGLGNFCFDRANQRNSIWNEGYLVKLKLSNDISFEIFPYEQCNDTPEVRLKKESEIEEFNHIITFLNNIISDPLLVETNFERYCKSNRSGIMGLFSPYNNRYLRGAAKKGIIPFFLTKKKIAQIYDYIHCEAHRNIVLKCLFEEIGKCK